MADGGDRFFQTRLRDGRVPVSSARVEGDAIAFQPLSPMAVARGEASCNDGMCLQLLDLVRVIGADGEMDRNALAELAGRCGPLLGRSDEEPTETWECCARVADFAVRLKSLSISGGLPASVGIANDLRLAVDDKSGAWAGTVRLPMTEEYLGALTDMPLDERREGWRTVCGCQATDSGKLTLWLVSFSDSVAGERLARQASDSMGAPRSFLARLGADIPASEGEVDEQDDSPELGSDSARRAADVLLRSIVAVHLSDARVDLFGMEPGEEPVAYRSCLSGMWGGFAKEFDSGGVGYCVVCGRPFSLKGHRGPARLYCSEACSKRAKEWRDDALRQTVPAEWLGGDSVEEIVARHFPGRPVDEGRRRVRSLLERSADVRSKVADAVREKNIGLVGRTYRDGLNVVHLLSPDDRTLLREILRSIGSTTRRS